MPTDCTGPYVLCFVGQEGNEKEDNDKPYIERTQGKDRDGRHQ